MVFDATTKDIPAAAKLLQFERGNVFRRTLFRRGYGPVAKRTAQ